MGKGENVSAWQGLVEVRELAAFGQSLSVSLTAGLQHSLIGIGDFSAHGAFSACLVMECAAVQPVHFHLINPINCVYFTQASCLEDTFLLGGIF